MRKNENNVQDGMNHFFKEKDLTKVNKVREKN